MFRNAAAALTLVASASALIYTGEPQADVTEAEARAYEEAPMLYPIGNESSQGAQDSMGPTDEPASQPIDDDSSEKDKLEKDIVVAVDTDADLKKANGLTEESDSKAVEADGEQEEDTRTAEEIEADKAAEAAAQALEDAANAESEKRAKEQQALKDVFNPEVEFDKKNLRDLGFAKARIKALEQERKQMLENLNKEPENQVSPTEEPVEHAADEEAAVDAEAAEQTKQAENKVVSTLSAKDKKRLFEAGTGDGYAVEEMDNEFEETRQAYMKNHAGEVERVDNKILQEKIDADEKEWNEMMAARQAEDEKSSENEKDEKQAVDETGEAVKEEQTNDMWNRVILGPSTPAPIAQTEEQKAAYEDKMDKYFAAEGLGPRAKKQVRPLPQVVEAPQETVTNPPGMSPLPMPQARRPQAVVAAAMPIEAPSSVALDAQQNRSKHQVVMSIGYTDADEFVMEYEGFGDAEPERFRATE